MKFLSYLLKVILLIIILLCLKFLKLFRILHLLFSLDLQYIIIFFIKLVDHFLRLRKLKILIFMRQIFCNKYSYYKFLEDLKDLPDSCTTQPYYDSEFKEFNIFYTFTRFNETSVDSELFFIFKVNKKELNRRISYSQTHQLFTLKLMASEFYPLLFDSSCNKLSDFITLLMQLNKDLSNLLDDQWMSQSRV